MQKIILFHLFILKVVNMSGLHRLLNIPEYKCLNVSIYVNMS